MTKILPINEIVGAVAVPHMTNEQIKEFSNDASSFLKSNLDFDVQSDINVVENTSSDVVLALPYYSSLDSTKAFALNLQDMNVVSGGEILISIFAISGAAIGFGIAAAATVGFTTAAAIATGTGIAGGVIGAAVVGTSIAAGVKSMDGERIDGSKK